MVVCRKRSQSYIRPVGAGGKPDLLAGHIDFGFPGVSSVLPYISAGKLEGVAVTGAARSVALPAEPTIGQAALRGYEATSFWGVLAPAKTPADIVRRLNAAVLDALKHPALRDAYTRQGNDITPGTPEAFAALIRSDTAKWARAIKSTDVKLDTP